MSILSVMGPSPAFPPAIGRPVRFVVDRLLALAVIFFLVPSGVIFADDSSGAPSVPAQAPAAPAAPVAPAEPQTLWLYPPVAQIFKLGDKFKMVVEPNLLMDRDKISTIESIRIESPKGRFLGLKTFNPKDEKRRAEFILDPKEVKVRKVKVKVVSSDYGEWISLVKLEATRAPQMTVYYSPPEEKEAKKDESKAEETASAPEPAQKKG